MGHKSSKHYGHDKDKPSYTQSSRVPSSLAANPELSNPVRRYNLSNFAVITVVFNPVNYKSRYHQYRRFEAHMHQSGVKLITVECIFESSTRFGLPRQNFEVTRAGNRHHIQLVAPSIIWMKENLINIAVKNLPQNIEYVAWLDADIEFERLDWPHLTISELQRYPIVQLFELSYFLGPGGIKHILRRDYSFAYSIRHNKPIDPQRYKEWYPHPGYAWAMHRSAFNAMGGLLDLCIIGSADLHFAYALLGRIEETIRPGSHPDYRRLATQWGQRVAEVAQNGANVGYVPINLRHYWHGERNHRNYVERWMILEKYQYSPLNDLEKNNDTDLLRLADKRQFGDPEMVMRIEAFERDIVEYFKSRKEDNEQSTTQIQPPPLKPKKPFVAPRGPPRRTGRGPPRKFISGHIKRPRGPQLWTSGPAGTHVDDHDPYWDQCTCPEHHHHPDNHDCPCAHHHMDDQDCWDPSEHEHDEYCDEYGDEHDTNEHFEEYSGYEHQHPEDWGNVDYTGDNDNYASGGGGFDNTDYGGAGSFY